jgi:phosphoglycolate phosphatase-like HAD superfamily hydrolase
VWDVEAAKAAGIKTIGVLSGGAYSAEELKRAGAEEVYENCAALLATNFPEDF